MGLGEERYDEPDPDPARVLDFRGSDFESLATQRPTANARAERASRRVQQDTARCPDVALVKHRLLGRHAMSSRENGQKLLSETWKL